MARALRVLAFWIFAVVLGLHAWVAWDTVLPGRAWPRSQEVLPTAVVLSGILTAGIATAWGGFRRRSRSYLAAEFVLLIGYGGLHLLVVNMFSRVVSVPTWSVAFLGFLGLVALAGAWGAVRDPDPLPGLRVRGWSRWGALAALYLSVLALAHLGVIATLARGDRWVTVDYAVGVGILGALAVGVAALAWPGLAFRRRVAATAAAVLLAAHSAVLVVAERRFEFRLDQPEPPLWPLIAYLGTVWGVAAVGWAASRRSRRAA